jgi:hypothetical protein
LKRSALKECVSNLNPFLPSMQATSLICSLARLFHLV